MKCYKSSVGKIFASGIMTVGKIFASGIMTVSGGFVVTMHELACETGSQIPRLLGRGIGSTVRTSPSVLWKQNVNRLLNNDYNMTFLISPHECKYSQLKRRIWCSKLVLFGMLLPLFHHVVVLKDSNCHFTMPTVMGRWAHYVLLHTFNIRVFKCSKNNSSTMEHICNESENVIGSHYRKVSNIRRTLVGNEIVDHSDVVGASPVGAAPTTSSFST